MRSVKKKYLSPALKGGMRYSTVMASLMFCLFLSLQSRSYAAEPGRSMLDSANSAYARGDFEKAANLYEDISKMGFEAPELYFNLGNAYFKLDKVGMSILNYERAKKLSPFDEDLKFNLKLANQRTLDKVEPLPQLFLEEWWDNLTSMHSERTWGIRSIVSFLIFLFFAGVFITSNKLFTKQLGFWLSILFISFSVFSFFIAKSSYSNITGQNTAVILATSAEVKNSPTDIGKKLFILHEGTKVLAPESKDEWVKIELTPEKVGWVKRSSLEFI